MLILRHKKYLWQMLLLLSTFSKDLILVQNVPYMSLYLIANSLCIGYPKDSEL
jgi:hypothetical protein